METERRIDVERCSLAFGSVLPSFVYLFLSVYHSPEYCCSYPNHTRFTLDDIPDRLEETIQDSDLSNQILPSVPFIGVR